MSNAFRHYLAAIVSLLFLQCAARCVLADERPDTPIPLDVKESWPIEHATHHVQGPVATHELFYISSVDRAAKCGYVYRVDRKKLRVEKEKRLAIGDRFHPGGMQLAGDRLWVPLAEYRPKSSSTILALDPSTFATLASFAFDDHIGALAADGQGKLYAGNWDCRVIYTLDEKGKILASADNPTGVAYQDFKIHGKLLWAAGRLKQEDKTIPVVDTLDVTTWQLKQRCTLRGELRSSGGDFCREGFCKFGSDLLLMPEDGPNTSIYRFALPPAK